METQSSKLDLTPSRETVEKVAKDHASRFYCFTARLLVEKANVGFAYGMLSQADWALAIKAAEIVDRQAKLVRNPNL